MGRCLTSLGVKFDDQRKCHAPAHERQGRSSLMGMEDHGVVVGGASSDG